MCESGWIDPMHSDLVSFSGLEWLVLFASLSAIIDVRVVTYEAEEGEKDEDEDDDDDDGDDDDDEEDDDDDEDEEEEEEDGEDEGEECRSVSDL